MSKYEEIYEVAADNYGIVTRDEAARMGVSDKELSRFTSDYWSQVKSATPKSEINRQSRPI